jgi:hypothetical protein
MMFYTPQIFLEQKSFLVPRGTIPVLHTIGNKKAPPIWRGFLRLVLVYLYFN